MVVWQADIEMSSYNYEFWGSFDAYTSWSEELTFPPLVAVMALRHEDDKMGNVSIPPTTRNPLE